MPDSPFAEKGMGENSTLGGEPVALATLIDHGVRLEWHEAVVVVRDICQLLRGPDAREPVPDLRHIWICANGRMAVGPGTVEDGTSADHPVAALGRLLLLLVDEARMPVQLRLVALSAASATPAYSTVDEFSTALAYFERPGGALPIRPVYSRWHALAGENEAVATTVPQSPPALRQQPPQALRTPPQPVAPGSTGPDDALEIFLPEKEIPTRRGRPFPVLPVAAAASVMVSAIVFVAWSVSLLSSPPQAPPPPEAPSQFTSEGSLSAVVLESWPVLSEIDLDASTALAAQGPVTVFDPRFSNSAPSGSPRGRVTTTDATRPTGGSTLASAPANPRAAVARPAANPARAGGSPPLSSSPAAPRQPAIDEQLAVPLGDPEGQVYSRADQDVVPPVLIRPSLNIERPPGVLPDDVSVVDVLVSDGGEVETIRLGGPAQDYREAMVFSAMKMWKFRPATKDGHPVRYLRRAWVKISPLGGISR
jgi:hypothetical protein